MGWRIFTAGFVIGLAAMPFEGVAPTAARVVGVGAWCVAVFIGLPWGVISTLRLKAQKRGAGLTPGSPTSCYLLTTSTSRAATCRLLLLLGRLGYAKHHGYSKYSTCGRLGSAVKHAQVC